MHQLDNSSISSFVALRSVVMPATIPFQHIYRLMQFRRTSILPVLTYFLNAHVYTTPYTSNTVYILNYITTCFKTIAFISIQEQSQGQVLQKKDAILMDNIFKKFLFSVCCKYIAIKLQARTDSVLFCKFHKL